MSFTLHGLGVSGGIAIGRAMLMSHATLEVSHLTIAPRMVDKEIERFDTAVKVVKDELILMKENTEHAPAELNAFIDIHTMFLEDPELAEKPRDIIRERRCNAEWALVQQMEHLVEQFEQFDDPYLRERKFDVVQVVERVVKELLGHPGRAALKNARKSKEESLIVVAHDLSPADTIAFKEHRFASFITDVGGATSHTAILARSMAIPAVLGLENARGLIRDGELLIVDGLRGVVIVNPDQRILDEYQLRKEQIELEKSKLKHLKTAKSETIDGVEVQLFANIELPGDVPEALQYGAEGIGLFRTEFLFMDRTAMPTEEEQFEAYKKVAETLDGKPVIIRTLDIGGDKALPYLGLPTEENPFLGFRAVRFCLQRKEDIYKPQLRALLRASAFGKVRIMVPLVTCVDELRAVKAIIEELKQELDAEGIAYDKDIQVGVMMETAAASLIADILAKEADFFSIGTNDLTQYTLAIDRQNEKLDEFYNPHHEAILRMIQMVVDNAHKCGKWAGICGELGADATLTEQFVRMGLDELSVAPSMVLKLRKIVREMKVEE